MGLGQTMLTAAVLILLQILTIGANRMLMESAQTSYESEAISIAADLANTLLDEIGRKDYNANVRYDIYQQTSDFTASSSFGPNASEAFALPDTSSPYKSIAHYSDVDDYHNYERVARGVTIKGFLLTVKVYYVSSNNPGNVTSGSTYTKRVEVTVSHSIYLPINPADGKNGIKIIGTFRY